MSLLRRTWTIGLALAVACGPDVDRGSAGDGAGNAPPSAEDEADVPEASDAATGDEPVRAGALHGVVRDAYTEEPVADALVVAGDLRAATDREGEYAVSLVPAGSVPVHAYRRGFQPDSVAIDVTAGRAIEADFTLAPADPPCCDLEGRWTGMFALDSAGLDARPSARRLDGEITFRGPTDAEGATEARRRIHARIGDSDLDFAPLLGSAVRRGLGDAGGLVFDDDSVAVTLVPRLGDWAVEMRGTITPDTMRGRWFQRASCCGAYGSFLLVRESEGDAGGRGI